MARDIGGGLSEGYEIYTQNKQKNAALSGANEAMLKPFLSDPEYQKHAPEGIDKFLTKRTKEGGLSLKDNIQLSGMLVAADASRKEAMKSQMAQQEMAGRAQEQQMNAMKIAAAQKQQAQDAALRDKVARYNRLVGGEGTGVILPGVQDALRGEVEGNPFLKTQAQIHAATGDIMSGKDLGGFLNDQGTVAINAAKAGAPQARKTYRVPGVDAQGRPTVTLKDAVTDEVIGTGPTSQTPHYASPEEARKIAAASTEGSGLSGMYVDDMKNYRKAGESAGDFVTNLDRMDELLSAGGVKTGPGQAMALKMKQAGVSLFGMEIPGVDKMEELENQFGSLVMKYVAETKGAVSNQEMTTFKGYTANLGKTVEGNRAIIRMSRLFADRAREVGDMTNEMLGEDKSPKEISLAVAKFKKENDLRDKMKEINAEYEASRKPKGQTPAQKPSTGSAMLDKVPKLQDGWSYTP